MDFYEVAFSIFRLLIYEWEQFDVGPNINTDLAECWPLAEVCTLLSVILIAVVFKCLHVIIILYDFVYFFQSSCISKL